MRGATLLSFRARRMLKTVVKWAFWTSPSDPFVIVCVADVENWCFCGGVLFVFLWCFCGGVLVVVFLWWCFVVVVVVLWLCFCGGVFEVVFCLCFLVFLWWCF